MLYPTHVVVTTGSKSPYLRAIYVCFIDTRPYFYHTMGLFTIFKKDGDKDRFITRTALDNKRPQLQQANIQIIGQLRQVGVSKDRELKLEYFFYTNTHEKAKELASALGQLYYSVKYGPSASNQSVFVITGWTNKIKMTDEDILNWVQQMCELGFKFDCDFDGWGTDPSQK
jgi:hypothetical protein